MALVYSGFCCEAAAAVLGGIFRTTVGCSKKLLALRLIIKTNKPLICSTSSNQTAAFTCPCPASSAEPPSNTAATLWGSYSSGSRYRFAPYRSCRSGWNARRCLPRSPSSTCRTRRLREHSRSISSWRPYRALCSRPSSVFIFCAAWSSGSSRARPGSRSCVSSCCYACFWLVLYLFISKLLDIINQYQCFPHWI